MAGWFETVAVCLVALSGVFLGRVFSGFRRPHWLWGYFLPFVLIAMLVAARCANSLAFVPPLSWIAAGRAKFVILSIAVTMGLTTPLSRLPHRCQKVLICILMAVVVAWFSILPFLVPVLIKERLSNLATMVGSDGVCFQSTSYTCGPAAAVTALRKLGLPAHEGQLAVLAHTSPVAGTLPDCLRAALQERYSADGLKCLYRHFDSLAQLREAGITLAVVKDAFLLSHCVAVLEVSDKTVVVADPVLGKRSLSHKQFEQIWRFSGIVLRRETTQSI